MPSTLAAIGIWFHRLTVPATRGPLDEYCCNPRRSVWFPTQCLSENRGHPTFGSRAQLSDKCAGDVRACLMHTALASALGVKRVEPISKQFCSAG